MRTHVWRRQHARSRRTSETRCVRSRRGFCGGRTKGHPSRSAGGPQESARTVSGVAERCRGGVVAVAAVDKTAASLTTWRREMRTSPSGGSREQRNTHAGGAGRRGGGGRAGAYCPHANMEEQRPAHSHPAVSPAACLPACLPAARRVVVVCAIRLPFCLFCAAPPHCTAPPPHRTCRTQSSASVVRSEQPLMPTCSPRSTSSRISSTVPVNEWACPQRAGSQPARQQSESTSPRTIPEFVCASAQELTAVQQARMHLRCSARPTPQRQQQRQQQQQQQQKPA